MSNNDQIREKMLRTYVELAEEERFVKDYHMATINKPDYGEAHLAVTNRRVLMYTWTKDTLQINSTDIADIRGIDTAWSKRQRFSLGVVLAIIGAIFAVIITLVLPYPYVLIGLVIPLVILVIGVYYLVTKRQSFAIIINIKAATGALTFYSYSEEAVKKGIDPNKLELYAVPGPESNTMAQELGALILTMQKE